MADLETLKGLLARVRDAAEPSVDLDEAIHAALLPKDPWWQAIAEGRRLVAEGREDAVIDRCNCRLRADTWAKSSKVSAYTGRIDAALALVDVAIPGAFYLYARGRTRADEPLYAFDLRFGTDEILGEAEHESGPLAVCAALLSALIAQTEQGASHGE